MDSFTVWMTEMLKDSNFKYLIQIIEDKRDNAKRAALSKGESEYDKGRYAALNWVVNLPKEVIKQFQNMEITKQTNPDT